MNWPWTRRREERDTGLLEYVETQADRIEQQTREILQTVRLIEAELKTIPRKDKD